MILVLGSAILWFIVFLFVPIVDSRFPVYVALLAAYILLAYIAVPNLIRLFRLATKPNHIPLYVTTGDGWPSDPVNIAIIAKNRKELIEAMQKAGWYLAEDMNLKTGFRELMSIILNRAYPEAPLSSLYLFGRKQDIGFEIPTNLARSARTRHHVRFWRLTSPKYSNSKHKHLSFWEEKLTKLFDKQSEIWIGAATEEIIPIDVQWYTGRLTHGGSHDGNRERDFIIQSLKDKKLVKKIHTTDAGETVRFRGQQFRTIYITDGSLRVVRLKELSKK